MTQDSEPLLHPVAIADLRPTQMTVGYREVQRKRHQWREQGAEQGREWLGRHMIPVVWGPGGKPWMIDNHHLARALHEEKVGHVLVRAVADLRHLKRRLFRTFMDNRNWLHPFDSTGHRRPLHRIPHHVADLADDPHRSLSGALRRAGGYAKEETPFAEFLWADYLRRYIDARLVEQDFERALDAALRLADQEEAAYLPGWAGPRP